MSRYYDLYFDKIKSVQQRIMTQERDSIDKGGALMADSIMRGNTLYAFGASHAGIITEELFYRTGGIALINPLFNPTLMLNTRPVTLTSDMERLGGFGTAIFSASPVRENDVIILHSVSGRNPVSIEIAQQAQEYGVKVIVITSIEYSKSVKSRHISGKLLYQFGDVVIDNCGDVGDSCISIDGLAQKVAPTSSVIGCMIANMLVIRTVELLKTQNFEPPVFRSANMDDGDYFNAQLLEKYKAQIHYM